MELFRITVGGYYPELVGSGNASRLDCDGVVVDAPDQVVVIGRLAPSYVRVPLIVKRVGKLVIDLFQAHSFWGDTANFRCGHVYINDFWPEGILSRYTYDEYHQDLIFQAYAVKDNGWELDPDGVIEHIHIQRIKVHSDLRQVNGIMLSERNVYRDLHIGVLGLDVAIESDWWFSANTLQHSVIGNLNQPCIRSLSGQFQPRLRVWDVKGAGHGSRGNVFWCATAGDVVPEGAGLVGRVWDRF